MATFFPRWLETFNFQPLFDPGSVKHDGAQFTFDLLLMGDEVAQLKRIADSREIPCDIYHDGIEYKVAVFELVKELPNQRRYSCRVEVIQ